LSYTPVGRGVNNRNIDEGKFFIAAPRWWGEQQKKMVGEAIGHPRWDSFVSRLGLIGLLKYAPIRRGGKGHDHQYSRQPDSQEK
jgi:hypothetical protein